MTNKTNASLYNYSSFAVAVVVVALAICNISMVASQQLTQFQINSLYGNQIVPQAINLPPNCQVNVTWDGMRSAAFGNEITPTQVQNRPRVTWTTEMGALYTLLMVDLDGGSTLGQVRQWLVVNIPGNNLLEGQIITPYLGGLPPQNTGFHKFVFVVFKQCNQTTQDFSSFYTAPANKFACFNTRSMFDAKLFQTNYKLKEVATNWFISQFETFVNTQLANIPTSPQTPPDCPTTNPGSGVAQ